MLHDPVRELLGVALADRMVVRERTAHWRSGRRRRRILQRGRKGLDPLALLLTIAFGATLSAAMVDCLASCSSVPPTEARAR